MKETAKDEGREDLTKEAAFLLEVAENPDQFETYKDHEGRGEYEREQEDLANYNFLEHLGDYEIFRDKDGNFVSLTHPNECAKYVAMKKDGNIFARLLDRALDEDTIDKKDQLKKIFNWIWMYTDKEAYRSDELQESIIEQYDDDNLAIKEIIALGMPPEIAEHVVEKCMASGKNMDDFMYGPWTSPTSSWASLAESYLPMGDVTTSDERYAREDESLYRRVGRNFDFDLNLPMDDSLGEDNVNYQIAPFCDAFSRFISGANQSEWAGLDAEDKQEVAQKFCDYLKDKLGVTDKVYAIMVDYLPDHTYGCTYRRTESDSSVSHIVEINPQACSTGQQAVHTLAHEMWHAYQDETSQQLFNRNRITAIYQKGFRNYKRPEDSFDAYRKQLIEDEAEAFATRFDLHMMELNKKWSEATTDKTDDTQTV